MGLYVLSRLLKHDSKRGREIWWIKERVITTRTKAGSGQGFFFLQAIMSYLLGLLLNSLPCPWEILQILKQRLAGKLHFLKWDDAREMDDEGTTNPQGFSFYKASVSERFGCHLIFCLIFFLNGCKNKRKPALPVLNMAFNYFHMSPKGLLLHVN